MFLEGKTKASGYGRDSPLARFWSALTIEVKFPIFMLCQAVHDKKMRYGGMLVQSCKLFRQYYIVIPGMVQIMMFKYSNVIKPDPFLCQLLS